MKLYYDYYGNNMMGLNDEIYLLASWNDNTAVMKNIFFKHKHNVQIKVLNHLAWFIAISNGSIKVLEYLQKNRKHWQKDTIIPAARRCPDNIREIRDFFLNGYIETNNKAWVCYSVFLAAIKNKTDVVSFLYHAGFDINVIKDSGKIAEMYNNLELIAYLYQYGYIPSSPEIYYNLIKAGFHNRYTEAIDQDGNNLFLMAVKTGNKELIKFLYKSDKNVINSVDNEGNNALHISIKNVLNEDIDVMILLITMNISIYTRNNEGNDSFNAAAKHGRLRLLKYLLGRVDLIKYSLRPSSLNDKGENIFLTAARYGHCFIINYLYKLRFPYTKLLNNASQNAFILASIHGHEDIMHVLRKNNNVIPMYKRTYYSVDSIVLYAGIHGHICVLKELKRLGYDMNYINQNLDNAIMIAANYGYLDTIKYLEVINVPYRKNLYGHDALMAACFAGHLDVVKYLFPNPIFTDVQSNTGMTAFLKAVEGNRLEIIKWLIDKVDIYARNKSGLNAMCMAISAKFYDIVDYLFDFAFSFSEVLICAKALDEYLVIFMLYRKKYSLVKNEIHDCMICYSTIEDGIEEFIICRHNHTFHLSCQVKTCKDICIYCTHNTFISAGIIP